MIHVSIARANELEEQQAVDDYNRVDTEEGKVEQAYPERHRATYLSDKHGPKQATVYHGELEEQQAVNDYNRVDAEEGRVEHRCTKSPTDSAASNGGRTDKFFVVIDRHTNQCHCGYPMGIPLQSPTRPRHKYHQTAAARRAEPQCRYEGTAIHSKDLLGKSSSK